MKTFRHLNAGSVDEALSFSKEYGEKAGLMAGGTDLLGILKLDILPHYPEAIINLKTIPGLDAIIRDNTGLTIGPLARLADIVRSDLVKKEYPLLAEAAETIAFPEIRNMGTIGGNLCQDTRCWYYRYPHHMGGRIICHRKGKGPCQALKGDNRYHAIMGGKVCFAVCPSDMAIALAALDAEIIIKRAGSERKLPVSEFYHATGNDLSPGEILTEIRVPRPPERARQSFLKFRLREPIDFAIVSVASVILEEDGVCKYAKIILGAVAPAPVRATAAEEIIKGRTLDEKTAQEAAEAAVIGTKPLSMNAYKVEITKTLVRRAIMA